MTIELVDGRAGTAHISSEDKAIIHQAKFGSDDMVYGWGDAMSCTMSSTTKAVIGTGCASIQGLDWHITAAETVAIANGSQGMKRNDIIAAHYHRDSSTGVETVALTVLKGTPNATAAADPTVPSGKILDGATDAYQPLWRIPLDGITVGTPVCLYNKRTALWDSVTHPEPGVEYHVGTWYDGTPLYRQVFRITNVKNGSRTQYGLPSGARLKSGLTYPQSYNVSNSYWHRTYSFEDGTLLADFGSSNTAAEAVVYVDAWYVYA